MNLQCRNLYFNYETDEGSVLVLENIFFKINKKKLYAILGPSGCGKSTLLKIFARSIKPYSGSVIYNDTIDHFETCFPIGYVPQKPVLMPWRSLVSNVMIACEFNKKDKENLDKIIGLIDDFELAEFQNKYPNELSGGMQQRASIVRALAFDPELVLMDEPFSSLDSALKMRLYSKFGRIREELGFSGILVTHDPREAILLADEIIILSERPAKIIKHITIRNTVADRLSGTKLAIDEMNEVLSSTMDRFGGISAYQRMSDD